MSLWICDNFLCRLQCYCQNRSPDVGLPVTPTAFAFADLVGNCDEAVGKSLGAGMEGLLEELHQRLHNTEIVVMAILPKVSNIANCIDALYCNAHMWHSVPCRPP